MDETLPVKGENVSIRSEVAICNDCNEKVFYQELDDKNLELAYSAYRKKHNLLTPSEIADIRKKYLLSQRMLGRLLEWGDVTVSRYESGAIQDPAHNEVLQLVSEPTNMKKIFEKNGYLLPEKTREALGKRIDNLIQGDAKHQYISIFENFLSFHDNIDEYTGFAKFDSEKIINLILYIAEKTKGIFETKLNKILWYVDFLHFKEYAVSITGSVYKHLPLGPVPDNYKWIIAAAEEEGLRGEEVIYNQDIGGIKYTSTIHLEESYFTKEERRVIDFVVDHFSRYTSKKITDASHNEDGYKETNSGDLISYRYASKLSIDLPVDKK